GVAGVDGAVGLHQVHGGAVGHGDVPVQGADGAGGEGEGQLTQGVADGYHIVAHIQIVRISQHHGGEAFRFDFQHRHVVGGVIAYQLGVIGLPFIHGNGDGIRIFHHVVVGEDVAVIGDDEAGAGGGVDGLVAPEVGGDGGGDAHGG